MTGERFALREMRFFASLRMTGEGLRMTVEGAQVGNPGGGGQVENLSYRLSW
jgi:hypothetical protein